MSRQSSLFESERSDMHNSIQHTIDMLNEYGPLYDRWSIAWSGGKDSTAVVTLVAYLIASGQVQAPKDGLEVLYADTRMELLPLWHVAKDVKDELEERGIKVRTVVAPMDKRFLVYILGRGVPPPNNNTLRWCTRQIKLEPMQEALKAATASGPVLVLTGVRLGESAARDQRIAVACSTKGGTECGSAHFQGMAEADDEQGPKFFQPAGENGLATLAPIVHWRICHVWRWLCEWAPQQEFGGWETAPLAEAYGGRDGDEAQEIGARTGCVACPLAQEDTALNAILKIPRWAYLEPLKELRPVYRALRQPQNRLRKATAERRKDGRFSANAQRMGPITLEARTDALSKIVDIQARINAEAARLKRPKLDILSAEEITRIKELIEAGTWPDKWLGTEPLGSDLIPAQWVIEDEDGQRVIEQPLLFGA